jgi:hypothetical protein
MTKKYPMQSPIQAFIEEVVNRRRPKYSLYRLALKLGWSPAHIYQRVRKPTTHRNIEMMLAGLGIEVRSGSRLLKLVFEDGVVKGQQRKR